MVQLFVNNQEVTLKEFFTAVAAMKPLQTMEASLGSTALGVGIYYLITREEDYSYKVSSEVSIHEIEDILTQYPPIAECVVRCVLTRYREWSEEVTTQQLDRIAQDEQVQAMLSRAFDNRYPELEAALLLGEEEYQFTKDLINMTHVWQDTN